MSWYLAEGGGDVGLGDDHVEDFRLGFRFARVEKKQQTNHWDANLKMPTTICISNKFKKIAYLARQEHLYLETPNPQKESQYWTLSHAFGESLNQMDNNA